MALLERMMSLEDDGRTEKSELDPMNISPDKFEAELTAYISKEKSLEEFKLALLIRKTEEADGKSDEIDLSSILETMPTPDQISSPDKFLTCIPEVLQRADERVFGYDTPDGLRNMLGVGRGG